MAESQIHIASRETSQRFATMLALVYGAQFAVLGVYLPFFTVWLKAIGIDAFWIGIIAAVPSITRFTLLPVVTGMAERRQALRGAIILAAFSSAAGFVLIGTQHQPLLVFLVFAAISCVWTPMVPLTDAYALKGVARYGLSYGPLRLWGSASFILGAVICGLLAKITSERDFIWIIAAFAGISAAVTIGLRPLDRPKAPAAPLSGSVLLLREPGFLAIVAAAALIQGSHVAYYTFASITWQAAGLDGATIAGLWVLGVIAEIVVFALSPRFTLSPVMLMVIGAFSAVLRWVLTAQEPSVTALALIQLSHGLTYGVTQVGTMILLLRHVPPHVTARGQGYLAAFNGIVASVTTVLSGIIYTQYGQGVYYAMAAMAVVGAVVIWSARRRLEHRF